MSDYDRVMITGGGGMLAKALAERLRARGVHVDVRDRATLDITDALKVHAAFDDPAPTLVLNCAAYTKVDLAEQEAERANLINGYALQELAENCANSGALLVHFSTDFVFNGVARSPYKTNAKPNPQSAYGRSKSIGEEQIHKAACDALIIRTAWLYGPGGPSFPKTMLDVARAGKPLRVVNDQIGSPTFTYDLADATLDLIDAEARGIYHVTNFGQTSWFDFARAIFEEFGLQPDLQPITSADWKRQRPQSASRPAYSVLDLSKFEETVRRSMRPWREGLADFKRLVEPNKS